MKNSLRLSVPVPLVHLACVAAATLLLVGVPRAHAGVLYQDPAGNWDYVYNGDADACGDTSNFGIGALDGNWQHNQSDKWDCTAPGGTIADGVNEPGGVVTLTETNTTFLRLQDTGYPKDWGFNDPSNRRFYFGHDMRTEHPTLTSPLTNGLTISFRARLSSSTSQDPNDPFYLDPVYPQTSPDTEPEFPALTQITPWPAGGKGYNVKDDGKGMFTVQEDGLHAVGFALALDEDTPNSPAVTPNIGGGLVMNNRAPSTLPGSDQALPTTVNLVPISDADLLNWHEFWITIKSANKTGGPLNYVIYAVDVYMDGSTTPQSFEVEGSIGAEFAAPGDFLCFGLPSSSSFGAFDVDFYAYKVGVLTPVPEPTALATGLAAFGALSLLSGRRLRSRS